MGVGKLRIAGLVLVVSWAIAWAVVSQPIAPPAIFVEKAAIAGGDVAAVSWREDRPGSYLRLRTAIFDGQQVTQQPPIELQPKDEFQLIEAGPGRFLLRISRPTQRWIDFVRFDRQRMENLPPLKWTAGEVEALVAAGDEVALQFRSDQDRAARELYVLDAAPGSEWRHGRLWTSRKLVLGGGAAHVSAYWPESRWSDDWWLDLVEAGVNQKPELSELVRQPDCVSKAALERIDPARARDAPVPDSPFLGVTSVVQLPDGWARLSRYVHGLGCVDGVRGGEPFHADDLALGPLRRLRVGDGNRLVLDEGTQGAGAQAVLSADGKLEPALRPSISDPEVHFGFNNDGGPSAPPYVIGETSSTAVTRISTEHGHVVKLLGQRQGQPPRSWQLAPEPPRSNVRALRLLAPIALVPLGLLLASALLATRAWRGLRRREKPTTDAALPTGRVAIEGVVEGDSSAPEGALRVRRGNQRLWLFIEGAEVLRATSLRGAAELGGDAVDVAAGAEVYAEGVVDLGTAFRSEPTLRAGAGHLVLAGMTLRAALGLSARRAMLSSSLFAVAMVVCVWISRTVIAGLFVHHG